jgi:hypothetical protein
MLYIDKPLYLMVAHLHNRILRTKGDWENPEKDNIMGYYF